MRHKLEPGVDSAQVLADADGDPGGCADQQEDARGEKLRLCSALPLARRRVALAVNERVTALGAVGCCFGLVVVIACGFALVVAVVD